MTTEIIDPVEARRSSSHDFDFLFGEWQVHHRKLARRLVGCEQWLEFQGWTRAAPILGGAGNFDDNVLDDPGGTYRALTLRRFDPVLRLWSIWWVDARTMRLDPPVHGGFEEGSGLFLGDDTFEGRPIQIRFLWSKTGPDSARWEQAFRGPGSDWETNWIMHFERQL